MNAPRYFKHLETGDMWSLDPQGKVQFRTRREREYGQSSWTEADLRGATPLYLTETDEHGTPLKP